MQSNTITIDVQLDENKMPEQILWQASGSSSDKAQRAKAMLLAMWDGADKSALRIDLWTKDMMVDEMTDFVYQTLMTMADTYNRATKQSALSADMKEFAKAFYQKFREAQMATNKLT